MPLATPTEPAMMTWPGKCCAGTSANGSALLPLIGSSPSLPAEITRMMPALDRRCIADSSCAARRRPAKRHVDHLGAGRRAASMPCGDRARRRSRSRPSAGAAARIVGAEGKDRRIERDADILRVVARGGGGRGHRGAMAVLVAERRGCRRRRGWRGRSGRQIRPAAGLMPLSITAILTPLPVAPALPGGDRARARPRRSSADIRPC